MPIANKPVEFIDIIYRLILLRLLCSKGSFLLCKHRVRFTENISLREMQ